jgi:hypothetical protein
MRLTAVNDGEVAVIEVNKGTVLQGELLSVPSQSNRLNKYRKHTDNFPDVL